MFRINSKNQKIAAITLTLISLLIAFIVKISTVSKTNGDSFGSLLTAQAIIEKGTLKLDSYDLTKYDYTVREKNNHQYYYFPLGTPVSSVPFVYLAKNFLGLDMQDRLSQSRAQKGIAIVTGILCLLLMYLIARLFISSVQSLLLVIIFWFGTSFASTMGTALWSHNFAAVYSLISLYLFVHIYKNKRLNLYWLLGISLFMAYLTRPTLSLLSIFMVASLFLLNKKVSIKVALTLLICLLFFTGYSYFEFKQFLPDYYLPKRLSGDDFFTAFTANLISPSRGLFIFSPFLLVVFLNVQSTVKIFFENKFMLFLAAWMVVHLLVISRFYTWWGGYSFGPRLMADVLPCFFIWMVLFLKYAGLKSNLVKVFLLITVLFSIYVNTYQALFNKYTELWNGFPSVDKDSSLVFDWQYPQFLHTKNRHFERINFYERSKAEEFADSATKIKKEQVINFNSKDVLFLGWAGAGKGQRWSLNESSEIQFKTDKDFISVSILEINYSTMGFQKIEVSLNGSLVKIIELNSSNVFEKIKIDNNLFQLEELNKLRFKYSNPQSPPFNKKDKRKLAMAIKTIVFK